jgi:hypothetical protein
MTDTFIHCRDGCGAAVADEDEATAAGWSYLEIQKRYRCPDCEQEIQLGGAILCHTPTQKMYRVEGFGKMRLADGTWVRAARYVPTAPTDSAYRQEFYRPLTDFGNFTKKAGDA